MSDYQYRRAQRLRTKKFQKENLEAANRNLLLPDAPHRTFTNIYDFYKLPDDEAAKLIGQRVQEIKPDFHPCQYDRWFFPIGLKNPFENYNKPNGLIFVSPIWPPRGIVPEWFRVGAFSPDDLDADLDFIGAEIKCRDEVIQFLLSIPLLDTSYDEVLTLVQQHVGLGTRTS